MANTWMGDYNRITQDWDFVADAEKFTALGRLFHAAHAEGRIRERKGQPMGTDPEYNVPDTGSK